MQDDALRDSVLRSGRPFHPIVHSDIPPTASDDSNHSYPVSTQSPSGSFHTYSHRSTPDRLSPRRGPDDDQRYSDQQIADIVNNLIDTNLAEAIDEQIQHFKQSQDKSLHAGETDNQSVHNTTPANIQDSEHFVSIQHTSNSPVPSSDSLPNTVTETNSFLPPTHVDNSSAPSSDHSFHEEDVSADDSVPEDDDDENVRENQRAQDPQD